MKPSTRPARACTPIARRVALVGGLGALSALALAACSPLRALNVLTPNGAASIEQGVAYAPGPRQRLDIYRPAAAAPAGGWPVVVFFYGGTWRRGERADYAFVGQALAARGVLTLVADYRLYPEVRYPAFLDDSAAALAWGLRQAQGLGGNPARVFVMGHSAGAYNAAMLALDSRWLVAQGTRPQALAGWIGLAGPYDFLPIQNPDAQPVFFHPHYPPGSQPMAYAHAGSPRAFLAVGQSDDLVNPQRNTLQMAQQLSAAGVPVVVRQYGHVNHLTLLAALSGPLRLLAPVLDEVAAFVHDSGPTPGRAG